MADSLKASSGPLKRLKEFGPLSDCSPSSREITITVDWHQREEHSLTRSPLCRLVHKGGVINYQKSDFSLKIDILLHNWASK